MLLRKAIHITLALLLLVTTLGITVNMYYCHGDLRTVKIFKVDKPCCTVPNCCQTETISVRLDDDYVDKQQFEFKKIEVSKVVITVAFLVPQQVNQNAPSISLLPGDESPPIVADIPILLQSFLI